MQKIKEAIEECRNAYLDCIKPIAKPILEIIDKFIKRWRSKWKK